MTDDEILAKVGEEALRRVRLSQHDFNEEDQLVDLGAISAGEGYTIPVQVNRTAMDADLLIGLGNIIPHCGAGYSGGAKIVQPGVCGFATTAATHVTATVLPEIPLGEVDTPCRRGMEEVARTVGLAFIVNVVQDPHHRIVEIVAGDCVDAHRAGVAVSRRAWGVPVPEPADIVVVSSYPADIDWWQGEKGLIAAYFAVKEGGVIVFCTPCPEGLEHNHPRLRFWLQTTFAEGIEMVKAADPSDRRDRPHRRRPGRGQRQDPREGDDPAGQRRPVRRRRRAARLRAAQRPAGRRGPGAAARARRHHRPAAVRRRLPARRRMRAARPGGGSAARPGTARPVASPAPRRST